MPLLRFPLLCLTMFGLASCMVGPDYERPDTADITPANWSWQPAAPGDDIPRGEWWKVFRDSELDRLEARALAGNQTLRAAVARVVQARARASISAAPLAPDIRANGTAKRERTSGNQPTPFSSLPGTETPGEEPTPFSVPSAHLNTFTATFDLSYEIDFWGKVRRAFESARAEAASSSADYHTALLTLTGDVAAHYFQIRAFDAELAALRRTIELRTQALKLIEQRAAAGAVSEIDAARALTEVANARAELASVKLKRQEIADTLALLCGEPATNFRVAENPLRRTPPDVPAGLPAGLLERRPDIASAERIVAARNADIGVATAAYFPSVTLTGQGGSLSKDVDSLFSANSNVWSIGPSVSLPITGWAVIGSNVKRTKAAREEAVANYRQAVLAAVRDVETSLAQIRYLREQSGAQNEALVASTKATDLIRASYERGTLSYLELLDAERTRLQAELQTARIAAQRHLATVRLIKALGGGW